MLPEPITPKQIQILVYLKHNKEFSKHKATPIIFYPFMYNHLKDLQNKGLITKSFNGNGKYIIYKLTEFGEKLAGIYDIFCGDKLKSEGWI